MNRVPLVVGVVAGALVVAAAGSRPAGTPVPGRDRPSPRECRVAPRSPASIRGLLPAPATPPAEPGALPTVPVVGVEGPPRGETVRVDGTPIVIAGTVVATRPAQLPRPTPTRLPAGTPADAATTAAVKATLREVAACGNAQDSLRVYALFTDAGLHRLLANTASSGSGFVDALSTPRAPLLPERRGAVPTLRELRALPDGRVAATAVLDDPAVPGGGEPARFVLARVGDRWLIDDVLPAASPPGRGTPGADPGSG